MTILQRYSNVESTSSLVIIIFMLAIALLISRYKLVRRHFKITILTRGISVIDFTTLG